MGTFSHIVRGTETSSGEFVLDGVGNEIIDILGFRLILPEGAPFPRPHQLILNYEQKNSRNMLSLASAQPGARRNSVPCTAADGSPWVEAPSGERHRRVCQGPPFFIYIRTPGTFKQYRGAPPSGADGIHPRSLVR